MINWKVRPGDNVVGKAVKLSDTDIKRKIPKTVIGYSYKFGYPEVLWKDNNGMDGSSFEKKLKKVGRRWLKTLEEQS